ncbi:MAG: twin-arginine translocation signal domain-containing protein [Pirellulales bacterium]|nr:twin-arginine translocation signal domain-containing protein [Pirellulales bacterium]
MSQNSFVNGLNRRNFLGKLACCGCAAAGFVSDSRVAGQDRKLAPVRKSVNQILDEDIERLPLSERPKAADHSLVAISGTPRERGRSYGRRFAEEIRQFLKNEIYDAFAAADAKPERLLRYAGACLKPIRRLSPTILDEMEGMAEGAGLRVEEFVLLTLHEQLWHKGVLPSESHCTAAAVAPPTTVDGNTYVAQSWDWMSRVYGKSQMLRWERREGPSVLSYSYPGLWIGAGLNSAGIALCWTSGQSESKPQLVAELPTYVLLTHLLYQPTLEAVVEEARRAEHAGWFTFVMADAEGHLLNLEGSPEKIAVERHRGSLARAYYGSREMTRTAPGEAVDFHARCRRMMELIENKKGQIDLAALQGFYADHRSTLHGKSKSAICMHFGTLDAMVFNTTRREASISRGPGCLGHWQRFTMESKRSKE